MKVLQRNGSLLHKLGVRKIGLFGSFLKRSEKRGSDLDFIVQLDPPTFDSFMEVKFLLERKFHRKVDLVTIESIKAEMEHVKREAAYAKIPQ